MQDGSTEQNYFENQKIIDLKNFNAVQKTETKRFYKKKILAILIIIIIAVGTWYVARANQTLEIISVQGDSMLEKIIRMLPLSKSMLLNLPVEKSIFDEPNTEKKRINYLLLSMRGADDPNGGLLTDSIMMLSVRPYDNKLSLVSIPRDLYVAMPGTDKTRKLNEAYEIGEKKSKGYGLNYASSVVGDITGQKIHFAAIINFKGFSDLIDSLGGVELDLDKPFVEAVPFEEGSISLPAGKQTINGKTALLYTRSRMSSSDFDRSRRQQEIIKAIYAKIIDTGIVFNPYRLDKLLKIVEKNFKTNMKAGEIEETLKLFKDLKSLTIKTKVIDNGPEKLLYSSYNDEGAYILLPTDGNYNRIREDIKNIFN